MRKIIAMLHSPFNAESKLTKIFPPAVPTRNKNNIKQWGLASFEDRDDISDETSEHNQRSTELISNML